MATSSTSTTNNKWVHKPRVASFTCKTVNGKREFHAVNDRAHKLCRKVGKRSIVTATDLKAFKGYFKLRQYNEAGKLVAVRV